MVCIITPPSWYRADDRLGVAIVWGILAILMPIIRQVVVVESYLAFGFVSAFVITSTTIFFARNGALRKRGIDPASAEARSLRFADLRGMIGSCIMAAVLVTQKTDALVAIALVRAAITLFQIYIANGGLKRHLAGEAPSACPPAQATLSMKWGFSGRMIRLGSEVYLMPSKR